MRPPFEKIREWQDIVGVEIGVQFGYNAKEILDGLDIKKLYLIDPYKDYPNISGRDSGKAVGSDEGAEQIGIEAKEFLKPYSNKIEWVIGFSWDVVDLIPNNLDFVYIDGDHREEAVLKDISFYYDKVKEGGLFAGHDARKGEVTAGLKRFFGNLDKITIDHIDWYMFR
jgi:predicted O-methyltransferase YrrM